MKMVKTILASSLLALYAASAFADTQTTKYLIFVEIKIGNDKLSPGQDNIGRKLSSASVHNKNTFYKVIRTLEDAQRLVDHLVKGDL